MMKKKNATKSGACAGASLDELLDRHGLKKTPLRRALLEKFFASAVPLSQADLIQGLGESLDSVDRVSIYRNLNQMKKAGLVHEVDVNSYVACSHDCGEHPHLLLFCQNCQRHREVKDHSGIAALFNAVKGLKFFSRSEPLYLKGVCEDCAAMTS